MFTFLYGNRIFPSTEKCKLRSLQSDWAYPCEMHGRETFVPAFSHDYDTPFP
jgi:hypothetical protein